MHEYPITLQIIKIAENTARDNGAQKVCKIELVVGDYSGFIGESIQMYFDAISKDTLCQGAEITVQRIKPQLRCDDCGALFEKVPFSFACPQCGGSGGPTEIGKEFYIKSIAVE